jgi:serine/threonine protein phosphatase 1
MATLAIGDVHANLPALRDLLEQLTPVVEPGDSVVFLGDYIDRGPDAKGCIERILGFREETPARVETLLGNHEDWLLRSLASPTRHSWLLGMEAFDTIASYSPDAARALRAALEQAGPRLLTERVELPYHLFFDAMPVAHLAFLRGLKTHHRTPDALCVHGGLDPAVSELERQPREALVWGSDDFADRYRGAERVVYGHWGDASVGASGWPSPRVRERTIGIDTIAHGVLTAVRLPDLRVFQSARHPIG